MIGFCEERFMPVLNVILKLLQCCGEHSAGLSGQWGSGPAWSTEEINRRERRGGKEA